MTDSPPTTPPPPRRPLWKRLARSVGWMVFWLMLYVLSIGPMFWPWHEARYVNGSKLILAFYMPLLYASEFEPFGRLLNLYINWWIS